ncbi:hypothetical protein PVAND_007109 [Polypedilum vanderplanki]|uniref:Atrial natriuretic peptide-converting enzyme-like protein n=1 Tax=Polypedilum vanderplanki TaxID=319348 RepID=A0A9J6C677_POLVA|nr:hypothetical protein PVAND_007109 [Polypedilum vanderplanki]
MAALVKELECRFENFTSDIKKSFFNRERTSSLVRSTNDYDFGCGGEKRQDKTETLKTQIASVSSVALSALKRDSSRESKESNSIIANINIEKISTASNQQQVTQIDAPKQHRERKNPPNRLALAPPPIPKRTFQGRIYTGSDIRLPKTQSKSLSDADNNKIDCANDLCSISFDDIGDSDDLVIFDKKLDPNQSSSDSSRSQTTIDTGYISAFETDRSSVSTNQRQFRGRFSSEDTQSSLDSYLSSDLQRADTIDSLHSNFTDSPFVMKKNSNVFNFDQNRLSKKISSSGSIDSDNNNNNKSISTPIKSCSRGSRTLVSTTTRTKSGIRPPIPPLRASQLADIMKDAEQCLSTMMNSGSSSNSNNNVRTSESNKPPPLNQIHHAKINQRQDSNISSDSYSMMSSPGYSTKNMEAPLLQNVSKINKSKNIHHQNSTDSFIMSSINKSINRNITCGGGGLYTRRQDSNISQDCFNRTSSLNPKLLDAPLLAHAAKMNSYKQQCYKPIDEITQETIDNNNSAAIIKSASTPASLQTIVRFSNGSNMSLQHKILRARKNSNPYVTHGRLRFRLFQILLNVIALMIIAGALAAYFHAYPNVKFINKTISVPTRLDLSETMSINQNPAPGICLPIIVKFCQNHKIPYNYTVFPNYISHFGQLEAQVELEQFDALVDVQCFELVPLYLCSLFVPKCSSMGKPVPPCRNLCLETMRRCGFFFDVFGLELPEYLNCKLFTDSLDSDECVGGIEMKELKTKKPLCDEFACDKKRCIPYKYVCDGVVDCFDQTDELRCSPCNHTSNDRGSLIHCGERKCMSDRNICDGTAVCPHGEDERNCVRLSSTNGDLGRGTLEVYKASRKRWEPACIRTWDAQNSPSKVCTMLGYSSVNSSRLLRRGTNTTMNVNQDTQVYMRMAQRKTSTLLREYTSCNDNSTQVVVELTCSNFECGKVRTRRRIGKTRIVGGKEAKPGDWPFLAAILGGPEEVFYCAGVLIADQWVLSAAHCIGNHTLRNLNDWTIQLGMTRRFSHAHYGQKIKVKKVIPHPQYNDIVAHDNDIALFQLATRVAFHDHLLPVCLPPNIIGWGKREDKNSNPNAQNTAYETAINEVTVPVLNRETCNEWLDSLNVTDGMICAGYPEGKYDACQGDSGGPLLCPMPDDREKWFVGGIVSWGIMCAQPKLPGVYANVPKYIPWILSQINNHTKIPENGG